MSDQPTEEEEKAEPEAGAAPEGGEPTKEERTEFAVEDEELA